VDDGGPPSGSNGAGASRALLALARAPALSAARPAFASRDVIDSFYLRPLIGYLRRLGLKDQDAEDVAGEAIAITLRRGCEVRTLKSFLFGTAHRLAQRLRRRLMQRSVDGSAELVSDVMDPERAAVAREQLCMLSDVLAELPAKSGAMFLARYAEGKTVATIAAEAGETLATVKNRIERIRKRIKKELKRIHGT
jgi:RNA polymerase sigma factor (sigma-70 family)